MPDPHQRLLIEDWLPIKELGIESRRERAVSTTLPPLNRLHVWWARRPLAASAAVVLAGLLPTWSPALSEEFSYAIEVASEREYHRWFLRLVGIWGDPVAAKRILDAAKSEGIRLKGNGYGYKQAYKNSPSSNDIALLHSILRSSWNELPIVSDPTAGGGSIPFVAARLGLPTHANDLNPIAASLVKAGVEYPATYGTDILPGLRKWGQELVSRVERNMKPYFPLNPGESVTAYIWANAVFCPRTGGIVPLLPDKWLRKERGKEVAVDVAFDHSRSGTAPTFRIVEGRAVDKMDADRGFVSNGTGTSPYDDLVIDGSYIKAEAKAGRMSQMLYAVAIRDAAGERSFRAPSSADMAAVAAASERLSAVVDDWQSRGYLPCEDIPEISNYDRGHRMYGINSWLDMFTPRQALVHGTFSREFHLIMSEVRQDLGKDMGDAVLFELALLQGKALNWNSRSSTWNVPRQILRNVFEKHNFSFKWTFAEFEGASALYPWTMHVVDNYQQIAELLDATGADLATGVKRMERSVEVTQGSAAHMPTIESGSIAHLCMDPPYYDNVMYAELSDYFYVWEKHTLGRITPSFFGRTLSDKENEAVANPARFAAMGPRKRELATLDYKVKMTAVFTEARRVLRDDGVMSIMFTHKRADAWDTLAASLLDAGFTIETSWPVNTEAEHSLHQANVNSAASTIMLVCRKRGEPGEGVQGKTYLEDIAAEIRDAAAQSLDRFRSDGIDGVDLLLSTYGPVLSVVSRHYPVYSMTATEDGSSQLVRPEEALDIAREEVVRLQRSRIVGSEAQIDAHTDFVLIAWETFKAAEFPFDEARRLALAVGGLDVKELENAKVVATTSGKVRLLPPSARVRRQASGDSETGVRIDATSFVNMNDAIDTVLYIGSVDGFGQAKIFMDRLKLTADSRFKSTLQGLVNAIPRTKIKGEWVVPQAGLLDTLVTAYFPDIDAPPEPVVVAAWEQDDLLA